MDYEWLIDENRVLISSIACSMNYETAVTFTYGHFNKVVFAVLVDATNAFLESVEKPIQSRFIPALTGQPPPGGHTQELLALPAWLGGLGLLNPLTSAPEQRAASQQISIPLVSRIIN